MKTLKYVIYPDLPNQLPITATTLGHPVDWTNPLKIQKLKYLKCVNLTLKWKLEWWEMEKKILECKYFTRLCYTSEAIR